MRRDVMLREDVSGPPLAVLPAGFGLVLLDGACEVVSANPAALALCGLVEQADRTIFDPRFEPTDASGRTLATDELPAVRAVLTGQCVDSTMMITGGDGRRRMLAVSAMPVVPADGSAPTGVVVALRESVPHVGLTERIAALEELNVALAEFAGRASHDLKSPLTAIAGLAATLGERWRELDDDTRDELIKRIAAAAERASRLVTDLFDESCRPRPVHAGVDPRPLVESVAASTVAAGDVEVVGSWPRLAVSPADLTTVVANLLDNAHHYGRDAAGNLHVTVEGQVEGDRFVLVISDEGGGLGPDPARLFEPFYRAPSSSRANPASTGLGLALVRRVAQRWGGAVSAGTAPGGGAQFRITLPLAR